MKYNTLIISDTHLGTKISKVEKLKKFLKDNKFDKIYLNGDIIDILSMKKNFFWKSDHNNIIRLILKLSKKTDVRYIIGNHDIFLETFLNDSFGNIKILERDIHTTKKGEKCLVLHGHQFDGFMLKEASWLYWIGDKGYTLALHLNKYINFFRKIFKKRDWSLSMYLKENIKNVIKFVNNFEKLIVEEAKISKVDTVICGHIHISDDKMIDGVRYMNSGCVTEFTSCIVEHKDGRLETINF